MLLSLFINRRPTDPRLVPRPIHPRPIQAFSNGSGRPTEPRLSPRPIQAFFKCAWKPTVMGNKLKLERISYEQDILLLDKKHHTAVPLQALSIG